ncbi:MAG TPA: DUF3300 domain-containing protein [Caldimonas sp.]|nr:DUF3300 domain-containing protein [Caldimonas sp.]
MRTLLNLKQFSALFVLCCSLTFATGADAQTAPAATTDLNQLVAPIALYPDPLVADILAAATYPSQIVDASSWEQQHPGLQGQQLADYVDLQTWDPSVKSLTQFASVLQSMNANLSWTSALGDAYANQPDAVMNAIQVMRQRAQSAGTLYSTNQQTVTGQDQAISIEPVDPELMYLPAYDPWLVYGDPLATYPGWVGVPGVFYGGPDLYFGWGLGIGVLAGAAWGWHHWGFDWHDHRMLHDHSPFITRGPTFAHHDEGPGHVDHRDGEPGRIADRGGRSAAGAGAIGRVTRAPGRAVAPTNAFSGFDHGGVVRGFAARGRSSVGQGFQGGNLAGGGFHGGAGFGGSVAHAGGGFAGGGMHGGGGFAGGGMHGGGGFAGGGMHGGGGFGGGGGGGHGGGGGGGHR